MPRMVASLATFVLIVISIGVNIWRYPVVSEMVGQPSEPSQSERPAQSTPVIEKSKTASSDQSDSLTSYAPGSTYSATHASSKGTVCDGHSCDIASGGSAAEQPYSGYTDESAADRTDSYDSYSYGDSDDASAKSPDASDYAYGYPGGTYSSGYSDNSSAESSGGGSFASEDSSFAAESDNTMSSDQRWSPDPITTPRHEAAQTPIVVRPSKEMVRVVPASIANDLAMGRHSAGTVLRLPSVDQGDHGSRWSNVGRRAYPTTGF